MRILKRMLDFIASRMLMVTVACALLIISFYLAMNTANIWVLIDDGLDARASVVLMGEDAGKLTSYFRPEFIAQDPVLQVGTSDTSPYRDYEIRGYDHRVKMVSVWSWPWENVARAEVVESIPAIDGTIRSAKREAALAEGGEVKVCVTVKNSGAVRGAEVVQLYISDATGAPIAGGRVPQVLRGFSKVWLDPGEERDVEFVLTARDLAHYDPTRRAWHTAPGRYLLRLGHTSRDIRASLGLNFG